MVCGHIHHAEMREVSGVLYMKDGDQVESCTALAEHHDGRMELIDSAARLAGIRRLRTAEIEVVG